MSQFIILLVVLLYLLIVVIGLIFTFREKDTDWISGLIKAEEIIQAGKISVEELLMEIDYYYYEGGEYEKGMLDYCMHYRKNHQFINNSSEAL